MKFGTAMSSGSLRTSPKFQRLILVAVAVMGIASLAADCNVTVHNPFDPPYSGLTPGPNDSGSLVVTVQVSPLGSPSFYNWQFGGEWSVKAWQDLSRNGDPYYFQEYGACENVVVDSSQIWNVKLSQFQDKDGGDAQPTTYSITNGLNGNAGQFTSCELNPPNGYQEYKLYGLTFDPNVYDNPYIELDATIIDESSTIGFAIVSGNNYSLYFWQ